MSNLIPFSPAGNLPAHLARRDTSRIEELTQGVGAGYPVISIKGKNFTLVKDGEREIINKVDSETGELVPARSIEVVIVRANPNLSKIWYAEGYVEGSSEKPDCFSNDGRVPDPSSPLRQAKSCAACKHNVFGSAENGKGKACSDSRRLAIATVNGDALDEPMLLRVPPASLRPLAEYARLLDKRGVDTDAVVTRLSFEPAESSPKLRFQPAAFVTEGVYAQAQELRDTDEVLYITGMKNTPAVGADEGEDEFENIPGTPAAAAVKAKAAKAADPADEPTQPAPAAKPRTKPRTKPAETAPEPAHEAEEAAEAPTRQTKASRAPEPAPEPAVVTGDDSLDDVLGSLGISFDD